MSPRTTTNASTSQGGESSPGSLSSPPTNGHTTLTSVAEDSPSIITTSMPMEKSIPVMPTSASPNDQPPPRKKSISAETVPMTKINGTPVFVRVPPMTNGDGANMDLSGG